MLTVQLNLWLINTTQGTIGSNIKKRDTTTFSLASRGHSIMSIQYILRGVFSTYLVIPAHTGRAVVQTPGARAIAIMRLMTARARVAAQMLVSALTLYSCTNTSAVTVAVF